jgi:D-alanine-D-alanine ligase
MIPVEPDWWKTCFNEIYLITDARSVCDQELTGKEVSFLEEVLELKPSDRILDLCGGHGRHSLELGRRGYRNLTVLDYSLFLIKHGKDTASREGIKIEFCQSDARSTGLRDSHYNIIIVMGNSFGYCIDEEDNQRILQEIRRLLRKGGKALLELTDQAFLLDNFRSFSQHQASEDIVVRRSRELDSEMVRARETVISKKRGIIRDGTYCERLYCPDKIRALLADTGLRDIKVRRNFTLQEEEEDYGFMNSRMIVTARK